MDMYKRDSPDAMTEDELFETSKEPRVEVVLPVVPLDNQEGLNQKFALGILNWSTFKDQSKLLSGYPSDLTDESESTSDSKTDVDPWNQAAKLSLLRSSRGNGLAALGIMADMIIGSSPKLQTTSPQQEGSDKGTSGIRKRETKNTVEDANDEEENDEEEEAPKAKKKKTDNRQKTGKAEQSKKKK